MQRPRRRALRASFVITLGGLAGCRSTHAVDPAQTATTERAQLTPSALRPANDGSCLLQEPMGGCPAGAMCNPPPLLAVDCPDAAVNPPPQHAGWLRVRPGFYAPPAGSCAFNPERWCPPAGSTNACEAPQNLSVPCTVTGTRVAVPTFSYEATPGRCARLPAFECPTQVGACVPPLPTPAGCDAATLR